MRVTEESLGHMAASHSYITIFKACANKKDLKVDGSSNELHKNHGIRYSNKGV